jgi:AcrR family transcriptional regulator
MPRSDGRKELLDAAAQEFASFGFSGATTASIARRAGVTQPLVHHHFGTKRGLWDTVLSDLFGSLEVELSSAEKAFVGESDEQRLREMLRAYIRFSGRHPHLSRMVRLEGSGEIFDALHARWLGQFVKYFEGLIQNAIRSGAVREIEPSLLFYVIVGAATEAFAIPSLSRKSFGQDSTSVEFIDRYADLVCDVVFKGIAR